jgi:tetratricopeptide (TPR) repeat protein
VDALRAQIASAKALQRVGRVADATPIAARTSDEAAALGYRPLEAEALFVRGDLEDDDGDYAAAEHTLVRSVAAAIAGRHTAQEARSLSLIVNEVGLRETRFAEAHDWALLARAAVDRVGDPVVRGELPRNLGRMLFREGKYPEARAAILECLAIWEKEFGPEDYAVAGPLTDLANTYSAEGEYAQAVAQYERSLAILQKLFGPTSSRLAPNLGNIGEAWMRLGEWGRAREAIDRTLALWEGALGPDHPKVAFALSSLSEVDLHAGKLDAAEEEAERALAIWTKALGDAHPDAAYGLHSVALVARARGEYDRALGLEERALAIREKGLGPAHDEVAESLAAIGAIRLAQSKPALAIEPLERAQKILESSSVDPERLAEVRRDLARARAKN